jgi:hypothetical protein
VLSVSAGGRPALESTVSGAGSIVQVKLAGDSSAWSAGSTARTRSVYVPSSSPS